MALALPSDCSDVESSRAVGGPVLDWLHRRFSGMVLSVGPNRTLWGPFLSGGECGGVCAEVLASVFDGGEGAVNFEAVGLSAWEVCDTKVTDLLELSAVPRGRGTFASVKVRMMLLEHVTKGVYFPG